MLLSADYVRNVGSHFLLSVDVNHVGDARFLNLANALAAISVTNNSFGCGAGTGAAFINYAVTKGATMASYAGNGLTSANDFGGVCSFCAFQGANPSAPSLPFLFPIGRSVYNGLQMKLTQDMKSPLPRVRAVNFQVAYSLSRFENSGVTDQDIVNLRVLDNNSPNWYFGPSGLDRTHQISFGGFADLPRSFRLSVISHFYLRILFVEDELSAARMLAKGLREHAYAVDLVADGEEALYQASINDYDLVMLDVMLPRTDGFEVCRQLRAAGSAVPVLMLTARDAVADRIAGLDTGADDYLTKPFDFHELLARVRALLQRGPLLRSQTIRVADLTIDTQPRRVRRAGRSIELTAPWPIVP